MPTNNPTSGNAPGLPALLAHIGKTQDKALLLQSLITALVGCQSDFRLRDLAIQLGSECFYIAKEINTDLDSVNLPEVAL